MANKIFLIRNVSKENFGGGETYQLKIASELKSHGFEPAILTNSGKLLATAEKQKIETFTPPYIKNQNWSGLRNFLLPIFFLNLKKQQKWYENLFRKEKPVAVNIQSRDDWISATIAAKKLGIKILWTDHIDFRSWVLWHVDKRFKNPIGKRIIKVAKYVDKIIFISKYEYDWFTSFPKNQRLKNLEIIHNGTIDEKNNYKKSEPEKDSFIYLGRIVDYKGISELLEAFEKVSKKFPDAKLNIYGDGPDLEKYKSRAKENRRIIFHSETNEPLKALTENETFVLPSYLEGLSLSLLDAAMMEKTIIVTDVGAASEVIEHKKSGYLIRPKSAGALAEAMANVLKDEKKAKEMAKNARKTYEEKFNLDQIFEQKMLPLYNDIKK